MRSSIQRRGGALILADAQLPEVLGPEHFDPAWWAARGASDRIEGGRGGVVELRAQAFHESLSGRWVLRHYRRGGSVASAMGDRYLRTPAGMTRAFREWRLLAQCVELNLPVPRPVACCVRPSGIFVRQDLITWQVPDAVSLSAIFGAGTPVDWEAVGRAIGCCHAAGLDHADLNAHNILLSPQGVVLLDLDRGRLRVPDLRWQEGNLRRLRRSLEKLAGSLGNEVDEAGWTALLRGHRSAL